MSTIHPKDRKSLCNFTFADGRRCTPRQSGHFQFCCFHARKQAQALAADQLSRELAFFLSGDIFSACDLATALGRLFAAVARGDVKPRAATLAYLAQTLLQTTKAAEDEYRDAFGGDAWRHTVYTHVRENSKYLRNGFAQPAPPPVSPLAPQPASALSPSALAAAPPPTAPVEAGLEPGLSAAAGSASSAATNAPPPQPQPASQLSQPVSPLPPTASQFAAAIPSQPAPVPKPTAEAGLQPGSASSPSALPLTARVGARRNLSRLTRASRGPHRKPGSTLASGISSSQSAAGAASQPVATPQPSANVETHSPAKVNRPKSRHVHRVSRCSLPYPCPGST